MMRLLVVICLLCMGAMGCQSHKKDTVFADTAIQTKFVSLPLTHAALISRFLHKFRPIVKDSLLVYSCDAVDADTFYYHGISLDSLERILLPRDIQRWEQDSCYACYRWPIDSARMALIVRVPSEYEASALQLVIWDVLKGRALSNSIELANQMGDAGTMYYEMSTIARSWLATRTSLHIITKSRIEDIDTEDPNTTIPPSLGWKVVTREWMSDHFHILSVQDSAWSWQKEVSE